MRRFVIAALLLSACEQPTAGSGRSDQNLADLSLDDLGDGVEGNIAGAPFEAKDVYYRIFRMNGAPRVDLFFAEETVDDCGLPVVRQGRRVFVRFSGAEALASGETTVDHGDASPVSIHYEQPVEGRWVGVGEGVLRLALDEVEASGAQGRIRACFDDGRDSCVAGRFSARRCESRLDGYLPREGTGVADPPTAEEVAP